MFAVTPRSREKNRASKIKNICGGSVDGEYNVITLAPVKYDTSHVGDITNSNTLCSRFTVL